MHTTRFTELLGCDLPIQQAGMGWVAMPPLVAAVSAAGGVGTLGAAGLPESVLTELLDSLRELTTRPFGVNFLVPFVDPACVSVAARSARLVEFSYGDPDAGLVDLAHAGGALAAWQVGSRAEAVAAERAGCDLIIAQGIEAGGHVRGTLGLLPLLDQVLDAVQVPVVAAGGIASGRTVAGVLAAGAAAARVGTRFVVAEESAAHPTYVEALLAAEADDTILTEVFSREWAGAPHRVLRSCVAAAEAAPDDNIGEINSSPIARFSSAPPTQAMTGAIAAMALYAGQGVGAVTHRQPAAQIVRDLMQEAELQLQRIGLRSHR